jgi:hypothetical protein
MERRYLVATLAIIATFAVFSRGFQSLQQISQRRVQHGQAVTGSQCDRVPSIVSHWIAKFKSELHPSYPEEAELMAEMNLPIAAAQARVAEQAAKQSQAAADIAVREAERARRDAARMQEQMTRAQKNMVLAPVALQLHGLDNLDVRVQAKAAAVAERIVARNVRMQVAAARLQAVSMQMQDSVKRSSPCPNRAEMR